MSAHGTGPADAPATYGQVFAVGEFRPLFGSHLLSTIGDELARVALTVLVYQRTDSAVLAALTFAISYLPWLLGGPVLSALADRLPRHQVLIGSDVARAVLVAAMAVPGTPLPLLLLLLLLVSLFAPAFEAARSALTADVLEGDRYAVATSLTGITQQVAQLIGFGLGGLLLTQLSASAALLLNAATFAVSAVWLTLGLRRRPAPVQDAGEAGRSLLQDTASGLRLVAGAARLRAIVGLLWVAALFVNAPEGIAAPWTLELQDALGATGLLLAANPAGAAVGGVLVGRFCPPALRDRLLTPLVLLSLGGILLAGLVPLVLDRGTTAFVVVLVLLFVAGLGGACSIPLNVAFVQAVPSAYRGRAFGVAVAGLYGVQGLGAVLAGVAADLVRPSTVVVLSGAVGLVAVVVPLLALRRSASGPAGGDPAHVASGPPAGGPSQA
ncbi:MFS transporter [Modestobacter sp. VKM Ac-2986]|uniref:MFS transporter n=1 Tax=Modestobacter sp. VKM Ac-2986 TaxID=3004140 RepID=UPI0022AA145D|nr:MFS transporter [Modestobacter sp. VKM Ac-2986]MCZ2828604.1 MFS transporter [Modestobacter sp. VKM Ac-2986]